MKGWLGMDYDNDKSHSNTKETGKKTKNTVGYVKDEFVNEKINSEKFVENKIEPVWISTQAAAAILGLTPNALRIRKCRGKIEYRYFGKYLRFNVSYLSTLFCEERMARKE